MSEGHPLAVGTRVRFSEQWLTRVTATEAKRFSNRVGEVTGYRMGAREPIVLFAKDGRRPEIKLFEVPLARLEVVTS